MLGKSAGAAGRRRPVWSIGRGRLLMVTAFALAVAVAAGAPKGPAHAADPAATTPTTPASPAAATPAEDAATWNPGIVTYLVDNSGCHTSQIASIDTATPALADTVSANLNADNIKIADFASHDPDVKVVEINRVYKTGTHVAFSIDAWLSASACAQATSTPTQQASLTTGHAAGGAAATPRVLGTVNLTDRHQVALMSAFTWFKQAVKVVFVAVAYAAIVALTLGVIAAEGGTALALAAQAALAGCIGMAALELIAGRVFMPDTTSTTKSRIAVAVGACIGGAAGGALVGTLFGPTLATIVRRQLNTTPAIMGDSDLAAAQQAGVDVTGLADLVDGVADGALRAAQ